MQLQYFGLSSFKITTKAATIISDPFDKKTGLVPPRGSADILMLSEKNNTRYSAISGISGEPFLIDAPGEYDIKGVTISGVPLKQGDRFVTIFLMENEGLRLLNLAHIQDFNLNDEELEEFGDIDILLLPIGGNGVLTAAQAAKLANDIEPRIVIPCHYKIPGLLLPADTLEKFIKELNGKTETLDKFTVKKKDLPEEGTKLIVLEPLR